MQIDQEITHVPDMSPPTVSSLQLLFLTKTRVFIHLRGFAQKVDILEVIQFQAAFTPKHELQTCKLADVKGKYHYSTTEIIQ